VEESDERSLPGRRAIDWASAALAGTAAISGDPLLVLLGPLAVPALQTAFSLDERAWRRRALRGARTLQVAASQLNISLEELAALIDGHDDRTELLVRVLDASAKTISLSEKIDTLGRVLASALEDDARIDEAAMLAAALMEMEASHARVLAGVSAYGANGVGKNELLSEFSGLSMGLSNVINVLTRHGLILERLSVFRRPGRLDDLETRVIRSDDLTAPLTAERDNIRSADRETLRIWIASPLGFQCLDLLQSPRPTPRSPKHLKRAQPYGRLAERIIWFTDEII
jgi:hypothetical protein